MEENVNLLMARLSSIEKLSLLAAKKVLLLDDVALLTGLSRSHLYKLTCKHEIPFYKPNGKQMYFDRGEVEAWMKQGRVATKNEIEERGVTYCTTGRKEALQ